MLLHAGIALTLIGAGAIVAGIVLRLTWARPSSDGADAWPYEHVSRAGLDRADDPLRRTGSSAQRRGGSAFIHEFTHDKSS